MKRFWSRDDRRERYVDAPLYLTPHGSICCTNQTSYAVEAWQAMELLTVAHSHRRALENLMTIRCQACKKVIDPLDLADDECMALMCTHKGEDGKQCKQYLCGFCFEYATADSEDAHHHLRTCLENPWNMRVDQMRNLFGVSCESAAQTHCPCCNRAPTNGTFMYSPNHVFQRLVQLYAIRRRVKAYWSTVLPPADMAEIISTLLYKLTARDLYERSGLRTGDRPWSHDMTADESELQELSMQLVKQTVPPPMVNLLETDLLTTQVIAGTKVTFPSICLPTTTIPIFASALLDFLQGPFKAAFVAIHTEDLTTFRLEQGPVEFWQRVTVLVLTADESLMFPKSTKWLKKLGRTPGLSRLSRRDMPHPNPKTFCEGLARGSEFLRNERVCNLYVVLGATTAAYILEGVAEELDCNKLSECQSAHGTHTSLAPL